jgi:hypothetical protein
VTDTAALERSYQRWLRLYPSSFRRQHGSELLGVLMATAAADRRKPRLIDCLDLLVSATCIRLRPRVSRSHGSILAAVRLMYLGAALQLAVVATVAITMGDIRTNITSQDPGYTAAQWHVEVVNNLRPLVISGSVAVGFWFFMMWANGRCYGWARVLFALFFATTTYSLANGIRHGSAVYAPADLAVGVGLWAVQLSVLVLLCRRRSGPSEA